MGSGGSLWAAEESTDLIDKAYSTLYASASEGNASPDEPMNRLANSSGAVALVLESRAGASRRKARQRGTVLRTTGVSWSGGSARQRVSRMRDLVQRLGAIDLLTTSGNGTSVDRLELAAVRAAYRGHGAPPARTTPFGLVSETFSVGPLAALAASLLCRRLTAPAGGALDFGNRQVPSTAHRDIGVICTDAGTGTCGITVRVR